MPQDVVHVPENAWLGSDRVVTWNDDVTIDTTALRISGPGAAGTQDLMFVSSPQDPSGPELALLYLADWTVSDGVIVRVVGDRPLVVISSGSIDLRGRIDAGGQGQTPGPGGADPGAGQGAGQPGVHVDAFFDSGGGGAGHATLGARGGFGCDQSCTDAVVAAGGPGGATYGDPAVSVLTGGSGGGSGGSGAPDGVSVCAPGIGGAGGGAVQLYAAGTITIPASGGISTGGGGGGGGGGSQCSDTAGGGGGSGGVVYLQAARLALAGVLAANGGGGGCDGGGDIDGPSGSDGAFDDVPAPGGIDPVDLSIAGGAGAAGASRPQPGTDRPVHLNGGGGGGAAGHIVLHCTEFEDTGITSPAAFLTAGCDSP